MKNRPHAVAGNEEDLKNQPHSFVFSKGKVGRYVRELVRDVRTIMEPFTASRLKVKRQNVLKDFVQVAGVLHVSHLLVFTKTEEHLNLRIIRLPHGPTLTFRVENFALARDVISSLKRYHTEQANLLHAPLLILNNFMAAGPQQKKPDEEKGAATSGAKFEPKIENHMKVTSSIFQSMFPSLNVNTIKLAAMKRCFLVNYNAETDLFDLRQYAVRAVPVGVSRPLKKLLVTGNKVPDLSAYKDASDFLLKGGQLSESEAELDGPANEVTLSQDIGGRGNTKHNTSAIRMFEMGPRLTLRLLKIEGEVSSGEVLYHSYLQKTPEEIDTLRKAIHRKKSVKAARRHQQELNVKRKMEAQQEKDEKKAAAKRMRLEGKNGGKKSGDGAIDDPDEPEDESEYYRQELGVEPEPELFARKKAAVGDDAKPGASVGSFSYKNNRKNNADNSNKRPQRTVRFSAKTDKKDASDKGGDSKPAAKKPVGKFFRRAAKFGSK